ncbi:MAG TPA: glycosyltransferase family 4 protein [Ferruginibacter sp.]|nr:glycosyltransferase family 4 protein [Ferruginibacter sp.]
MKRKKLAIITTHPIQYNAPLFSLLQQRNGIEIKVFYTWGKTVLEKKYDPGFERDIEWDIPLLTGYEYVFVENTALEKGSHHYNGIDNPTIIDDIKSWGPDAILVYGWKFKSHLKVLRFFKGKIPVLFRGDSIIPGKSLKNTIRFLFLKIIYRYIDVALYTGEKNRAYFEATGLKTHQLIFAPHAIDNKRFEPIDGHKVKANRWKHELGIGLTDVVFLFAGKLESKKNPRLLLETFRNLGLSGTALVVAGNGILEKDLKKEYSGESNIYFLDFQNQSVMPSLYQMADVFVLPSQGPGETWGLAVNEAMASAKPVLVSDACGCTPDLVENGVNGYSFPRNDQEKLQVLVKTLVMDKDTLPSMGQSGFNMIQGFSLEVLAGIIEKTVN